MFNNRPSQTRGSAAMKYSGLKKVCRVTSQPGELTRNCQISTATTTVLTRLISTERPVLRRR